MAYSSTGNPPVRIDSGLLSQRNIRESTSLGEGGALWTYTSTNLTTDLMVASHFSNAGDLGMRNGDTSGASLSTGGTITSTFA